MKGKFIFVSLILLSLLNHGISQKENIETIIKMPAKYNYAFNEGRKIMSDLKESENLEVFGDKLYFYGKQLTKKKVSSFFEN